MAKRISRKIAFDAIRVSFSHHHWDFQDLLEQNPTLSAIFSFG